ncbi:MAG: hypothetical protein HON65_00180 [Rhodospirillales bacterium]|jgi:hypothetical protein|nr:hypothetical protein [Rhodospirillales bacterium]
MSFFAQIRSLPNVMIILATGLFLTTLSGCVSTETRWQHETLAQEEWGVDAAQCKWKARQKAEKEYQKTATQNQQDSYEDNQNVDSMFASADIGKRTNTLFNRCMEMQGYVEVQ